jgi:hypothetical protein
MGSQTTLASARIEIRVERTNQLFDSLDPYPLPKRDLDTGIEDYIVGWARELPPDDHWEIVVHLPEAEATEMVRRQLKEAFSGFFRGRGERIRLDLKELFRIGRISLAIGIAVLAAALLTEFLLYDRIGEGFFGPFLREGVVILAWVVNWRPMEIFLYDWWPLHRRARLYDRLAEAKMAVRAQAAAEPNISALTSRGA